MKKLFALLLFASSLRAQTITTNLTNQVVQAGQAANFTFTVSNGPCRSVWYINGAGSYGAMASTFTYTFPAPTLAQNGTTVQAQVYSCASGVGAYTFKVTLVVTPVVTLQSLAMSTTSPVIGIGQTDILTVTGSYSDGTTKNLSTTATWTSDTPTTASVSGGSVLGLSLGTTNITASIGGFSASTSLTVEPSLQVTFTPTNEDGTIPVASLVISQIVMNADGSSVNTPVLQLPDPLGGTSLPLLYSPTLLYQAAFFGSGNNLIGQAVVFSPALMLGIMPKIQGMSYTASMCVTTCPVGSVKSMGWTAQ